jgi:hypothetical protein
MGERAADVPATPGQRGARSQWQPDQHARACGWALRRRGGSTATSDTDASQPYLPPEPRAGTRPRPASRTTRSRSRRTPRVRFRWYSWTRTYRGCARDPEGFRPLVLGSRPVAGLSRARRPRSTSSAPRWCVRSIQGTGCDRRAWGKVAQVRRRETARLPVRVRLPGQARYLDQRTQRAGDKGGGRQAAGRRAPGGGRPRHSCARVGDPRGDRLRPGQRDPLRPGPGQEQLRGQDVHPAEPDDQAAGHQAEAQSAQGRDRGPADRGRRLGLCAAIHSARS